MKNARMRKVNYGSLKSERARALVKNLERKRIIRKPLISKILVATGTTLALIIVGAMLTKIKNPASGEMQKETPAQIQKNKKQNEQRQRIKQLQNVLKVRARLKDRLSWYGEADAEEEKQETQEEIGRLEERLAHLEKELVELNWDRQDAIEEQSRLFDLILNTPGEVDPKIDAEYSKVSKKLGDMWELKGKIENAILETKERLDMENTRHWLVGREDEELQDIREIALRVIKDPDFSTPAVLDAIVTYRVANQMLGEEEMPEDLSKVSPTVKYI